MFDVRAFLNTLQGKSDNLTEQERKDKQMMGAQIAMNPIFGEVMRDVSIDAFTLMVEALRKREFEKAFSHLMTIDATKDVEELFVSMKQAEESNQTNQPSGTAGKKPDMPQV